MKALTVLYFVLWFVLWLASVALLTANVRWMEIPAGQVAAAIVINFFLAVLYILVMESLSISVLTLLLCTFRKKLKTADFSGLKLIINYNLLAASRDDVDSCFANMFETYMGNLGENIAMTLVSASTENPLKKYEIKTRNDYRELIFNVLETERILYLNRNYNMIDPNRKCNFWDALTAAYGIEFIETKMKRLCTRLARQFMCIHRVSRVLKKCGQYQDLMLLSAGYSTAFTYVDSLRYGHYARVSGESLFNESTDVKNILGKNFDYTLVLDGDTKLPPGKIYKLLGVAAAYPQYGILQPRIKLEATKWDTIYMNIEQLRQELGKPVEEAIVEIVDRCGYFGKGLIKNSEYIKKVIGTPKYLVEAIPPDVLSHDTLEATILRPLFVSSVSLIEIPAYNYISWNSRHRRWNAGDLITASYRNFDRYIIGSPLRLFQRCYQRGRYQPMYPRFHKKLDLLTWYVANISVRNLFFKPLWFLYVILHCCVGFMTYYPYIPIVVILAIVVVVSKIGLLVRCHRGIWLIIPELISSIFQYTPEILVGTVRFCRIWYSVISGRQDWVPQKSVEREFNTRHVGRIFLYSISHLWGYSLFGASLAVLMVFLDYYGVVLSIFYSLIYFNLGCIFLVPIFCFITSLRICPCWSKPKEENRQGYIADDTGKEGTQTNGAHTVRSLASVLTDTSSYTPPTADSLRLVPNTRGVKNNKRTYVRQYISTLSDYKPLDENVLSMKDHSHAMASLLYSDLETVTRKKSDYITVIGEADSRSERKRKETTVAHSTRCHDNTIKTVNTSGNNGETLNSELANVDNISALEEDRQDSKYISQSVAVSESKGPRDPEITYAKVRDVNIKKMVNLSTQTEPVDSLSVAVEKVELEPEWNQDNKNSVNFVTLEQGNLGMSSTDPIGIQQGDWMYEIVDETGASVTVDHTTTQNLVANQYFHMLDENQDVSRVVIYAGTLADGRPQKFVLEKLEKKDGSTTETESDSRLQGVVRAPVQMTEKIVNRKVESDSEQDETMSQVYNSLTKLVTEEKQRLVRPRVISEELSADPSSPKDTKTFGFKPEEIMASFRKVTKSTKPVDGQEMIEINEQVRTKGKGNGDVAYLANGGGVSAQRHVRATWKPTGRQGSEGFAERNAIISDQIVESRHESRNCTKMKPHLTYKSSKQLYESHVQGRPGTHVQAEEASIRPTEVSDIEKIIDQLETRNAGDYKRDEAQTFSRKASQKISRRSSPRRQHSNRSHKDSEASKYRMRKIITDDSDYFIPTTDRGVEEFTVVNKVDQQAEDELVGDRQEYGKVYTTIVDGDYMSDDSEEGKRLKKVYTTYLLKEFKSSPSTTWSSDKSREVYIRPNIDQLEPVEMVGGFRTAERVESVYSGTVGDDANGARSKTVPVSSDARSVRDRDRAAVMLEAGESLPVGFVADRRDRAPAVLLSRGSSEMQRGPPSGGGRDRTFKKRVVFGNMEETVRF